MKDSVDNFSFTDEELMEAVNTGSSDKFVLRSVGNGKSFRGYVIQDSVYGVRIADYIYSHAQNAFELKKRPGYEQELRAAARKNSGQKKNNTKEDKFSLIKAKMKKSLGDSSLGRITKFARKDSSLADSAYDKTTLRNCDYRLCIAYLNYSFKMMDEYIRGEGKSRRGLAIRDPEVLEKVKENLRVGYANMAFVSSYDVEDYLKMEGTEKQAQLAIDIVRRNTIAFESEMLSVFPRSMSFAKSPVKDAIILPIVSDSGKEIDRVYIPDSVENYPEHGMPTDAILREGVWYTPIMDTIRQEDKKPKM